MGYVKTERVQSNDPFIQLDLWQNIDQRERDALLSISRDQVLSRYGKSQFQTGVCTSGLLGMKNALEDGRWIYTALFRAGHLFDLRDHDPGYRNALFALSDTVILGCEPDAFDALLSTCPSLNALYQNTMKTQMRKALNRLADIALKTPIERISSILLEIGAWQNATNSQITLPMRRRDMGYYIGVKPETVSRVMRTLETEGVIKGSAPDRIDILSKDALIHFANGGRPRRNN